MTRSEIAAYSIDGRTFAFHGPVTAGVRAGAYVAITGPDGGQHLGQVLEVLAEPGATFAEPAIRGTGTLLAKGSDKPFTGASVTIAGQDLIQTRLAGPDRDDGLEIGTLVDSAEVPAVLRAGGFGRHTFVCGQSGSGKTYAVGMMLERLLHDTSLRIVVLDPNSDYTGLGSLLTTSRDGDEVDARTRRRHAEVAARLLVLGDDPGELKLWLGNLSPRQQATVLGLDPIADADEYGLALRLMADLGTTRFSPADVRQAAAALADVEPAARRLALRITNLRLEKMDIWADENHQAVVERLTDDWRALVFDLGAIHVPKERAIVSAAIVSAVWGRRHDRDPVLLVIDEAHNVCPQAPSDANQALATEHLVTIAAEGRKYGIYLLLATQRPAKIHEGVLSQCDNVLLMRMNSAADIASLRSIFSAVPPALIDRSATFRLGEGLAYGKIAPDPLLFKTGRRITPEGGSDVPADWARRPA